MTFADQPESLPVLDFRRLDAGPSARVWFLNDLRAAANTTGFYYIVGHGVDDELIHAVLELSGRSSPCRPRTSLPSKW
jgi:isopenicillin N synthase-like dioxygenase